MKLWRKEAMKSGKRSGRRIKYAAQMQESMFRRLPKSTPVLNMLFKRVGISTPPSFTMTPTAPQAAEATPEIAITPVASQAKEETNETV